MHGGCITLREVLWSGGKKKLEKRGAGPWARVKETGENLARETRAEALDLWKELAPCARARGRDGCWGSSGLPRLTPGLALTSNRSGQ